MATWKHVNANDVYPPELAKEIQKYYAGGYLWIPKAGYKERKMKRSQSACNKTTKAVKK